MAQVTKIMFSDSELSILKNTDFFFLKHAAIAKVMELFSSLERNLKENISSYSFLDHHTGTSNGKIFRGESYRQLPYVVLDYPKRFSADSIFTFRTMFWWGNEFSFTLHLQGHALDHYRKQIAGNISSLKQKDFFFCTNTKQWDYHFDSENYKPLDSLLEDPAFGEQIQSKDFIKLSRKIPVGEYQKAVDYGKETFGLLMGVLIS